MCNICRCFGWALDFLQRVLTFIMACCLMIVICIGMIVAITAGMAYGYNFSIAEYLDLKRSDVTVYVRRGQFADRPELVPMGRRSGTDTTGDYDMAGGNDLFASNHSVDYQDPTVHRSDSMPLSNAWQKAQDTRNYADMLTKYSKRKRPGFRARDESDGEDANALKGDTDNKQVASEDSVQYIHMGPNRTTAMEHPLNRKNYPDDPGMYANVDQEKNYDLEEMGDNIRSSNNRRPDIKVDLQDPPRRFKSKHRHKSQALGGDDFDDSEYTNIYKPV